MRMRWRRKKKEKKKDYMAIQSMRSTVHVHAMRVCFWRVHVYVIKFLQEKAVEATTQKEEKGKKPVASTGIVKSTI
jgi:hypothetical protein